MIWPLVLVAVLLGAWELYVAVWDVDPLVLPPPSDVAAALADDPGLLWDNFVATATVVAGGIVVALVAGALLAVAVHLNAPLRRALFPLLVGSQAVPVPVVAPLLVVFLGYTIGPKLLIVGLVCFFPVVVTTADALRRVDPDRLKLMRTLDASRWQVLRWVEAPAALPAALSGAKVAVTVAVIGAVLAEDAGAEKGLGHMITQAGAQFDVARSFAAAAVLAAFAVALFYSLHAAERRLAPWTGGPSR